MAGFTLAEILEATGGHLLQRGMSEYCSSISTDTRSLEKDALFIPLTGENFNGHRFINKAVEKGAAAVLISEPADVSAFAAVSVIAVENTLHALEALARFHRLRFSIPVIAVTGSNGKTTTKDMISSVLKRKYRVCHTKKNFNNEIGLSQTLLSLTSEDEVCVTEMGMRGLGQIEELCHVACPTIGVVTNVGTSHIGILGSRENIARAKGELIEALPETGTAILNGDDDFVCRMADHFGGKSLFYGIHRERDVWADAIEAQPDAMNFHMQALGECASIHLPMLGIHNVYDALAAAAAGRLLDISADEISKALAEFVPQGDSQKLEKLDGVLVLNDAYNANPLSVDMAFRALRQLPGKRHIVVLGDMLELGAYAEQLHREIGKKAAENQFDLMITVGPLARIMAESARQNGLSDVKSFDDCQAAEVYLKQKVVSGDTVLIKGSHAMHMEKILDLWKGAAE